MTATEAIRARRSIRKYREDADIPQEDIHLMLEAAMLAPSAGGTRPWEFVVIRNQTLRQQIADFHPYGSMLPAASLAIVACGRPDLQETFCTGYWPQDCGAAMENIFLQAVDLGYGACWCGIYPEADRVEALRAIIGVTSVPCGIIAIGVADEAPEMRGWFDEARVKYL